MVDLSTTVAAKSDQLNADDLVGGPITVRIVRVVGNSDKEQPISIFYEGDNGKPYKPGKSMRRVLIAFWGKDGDAYQGRWLTLFRDPEVTFGKIKVGGIRISHMSHIDRQSVTAIAVTKGAKREYKVEPLKLPQGGQTERQQPTPEQEVDQYIGKLNGFAEWSDLIAFRDQPRLVAWREWLEKELPDLHDKAVEAFESRLATLRPAVAEDDVETDEVEQNQGGGNGAFDQDD